MKGLRDILAENNIRSNLFNRRGSQANAPSNNNQKPNESLILRQRNSVSGAIAALTSMKAMTKDNVNENWRPYSYIQEKNSRNCSPNQTANHQKGILNVFDKKFPVSYDGKANSRRSSMEFNEKPNTTFNMQEKQDQAYGYNSHRGDIPYNPYLRVNQESQVQGLSERLEIAPQMPGAIRNQERESSLNKFLNNFSSERPRNPSVNRTRKVEKPRGHHHSNSAALENIEKVIEDAENGIRDLKKAPERKAYIDFSAYLKEKRQAADNSIANASVSIYASQKQEPPQQNPFTYRNMNVSNVRVEDQIEKERQRSTSISYSNSKGLAGREVPKRDFGISMISGLKHEEGQEVNIDKLKNHFMQYLSLKCQKNEKKEDNDFIDVDNINRSNFDFHYVIGKGGFGKVWKVQHKKSRRIYAMKEMSKAKFPF